MDLRVPVTLVRRRPAPPLAGMVAGLVGLSERSLEPVTRRQPAGTLIPLVISFGSQLTIDQLSDGEGANRSYGSFVAGLSPGHATTSHPGDQDCVQVYLTPLGVRRVLGVPGSELARRVVAIDDVARELGEDLAARIAGAATWPDRLRLVEAALTARLGSTPGPPDWVQGMWHELATSGGRAPIGGLVARTGWSHRYVATRFREEVGLTPKEAAGVLQVRAGRGQAGNAAAHRSGCAMWLRRSEPPEPRCCAARRRTTAGTCRRPAPNRVHRTGRSSRRSPTVSPRSALRALIEWRCPRPRSGAALAADPVSPVDFRCDGSDVVAPPVMVVRH